MEKICVYYDDKGMRIIDILPQSLDAGIRASIESAWNEHIPQKILIELSGKDSVTAPRIKEAIGHSMSTLHENLRKLENAGLIKAEMIYRGNKQRVISPNVLCVTRNPKHKERLRRFFQGMWVDSKKTKEIIEFLNKDPEKYRTAEEISLNTKIPVDEVEILLSNWDSVTTRGLSSFLKEVPFEKKVMYRGKLS